MLWEILPGFAVVIPAKILFPIAPAIMSEISPGIPFKMPPDIFFSVLPKITLKNTKASCHFIKESFKKSLKKENAHADSKKEFQIKIWKDSRAEISEAFSKLISGGIPAILLGGIAEGIPWDTREGVPKTITRGSSSRILEIIPFQRKSPEEIS